MEQMKELQGNNKRKKGRTRKKRKERRNTKEIQKERKQREEKKDMKQFIHPGKSQWEMTSMLQKCQVFPYLFHLRTNLNFHCN